MKKLIAIVMLSSFALVQAPAFAQDKTTDKKEEKKPEAKTADAKTTDAKKDEKKDEAKKPKKGGC
jgi:hypothetical protein